MKKTLLLVLVFTLMGCDDNLNKTENIITRTPSVCEEPGPQNPSSGILFPGIQSVTDIGTTSARVNWAHTKGAYQYHVLAVEGSQVKVIKTIDFPKTHVTISGLTPDTEYTFNMRAMDTTGLADYNLKTISFKTLPWPIFDNLKSLSFNGSQFVNIGNSSNFNTKGGKTISLWFNQSTKEGGTVFADRLFTFFNDSRASSGLSVAIEDNNLTLLFTNKRRTLKSVSVAKKFTNGKWHHLAITHDNSFFALYLNGEKILKAKDNLADFGSLPANIGAFTQNRGFNGYIDEFAFYKASMNEAEVKALYNKGTTQDLAIAVKNKSLMSWYRLGDANRDGAYHVQDIIGGFHGKPNDGDEFIFKFNTP